MILAAWTMSFDTFGTMVPFLLDPLLLLQSPQILLEKLRNATMKQIKVLEELGYSTAAIGMHMHV
jgi:hypothetical protein